MRNNDFILELNKYNITEIGFISAKPYNHLFEKDYKSIVVALFPYFHKECEDANISIYARGKDYHLVINDIFNNIFHNLSVSDYEIYADIGPEIDRKIAVEAGLGFMGINNLVINEKYGSYTFIGYALCNEEFEYSLKTDKKCMECGLCVKMCPGNALSYDGEFIKDNCLSHITQKKGEISTDEIALVKKSGLIFGCDECQRICPHNKSVSHSEIEDFICDNINKLYLSDIDNLSNKEFKSKYGNRAFSWRGKALLERNLKYFNSLYEHNKTES